MLRNTRRGRPALGLPARQPPGGPLQADWFGTSNRDEQFGRVGSRSFGIERGGHAALGPTHGCRAWGPALRRRVERLCVLSELCSESGSKTATCCCSRVASPSRAFVVSGRRRGDLDDCVDRSLPVT